MANIGIQQGAIGKQVGTVPTASGGEFGEILISELQPQYYEQAYRGNVFVAANPATITMTTTLTTTATVFGIANPPTSGKNMVLLQSGFYLTSTTQTAIGLVLQSYFSTLSATTTSVTINPTFVGGPGVTKMQTTLTLQGAPYVASIIGGLGTSAVTQTMNIADLRGSVMVGPGCAVAIESIAATTGFFSLSWIEVPI